MKDAQYIPGNQPPFHSYEFTIEFKIPLNSGCITSLLFDQYTFMGGAHGSTVRSSDTWDFSSGRKLGLDAFFPFDSSFQEHIIQWINQQISRELSINPATFFSDYENLVKKHFIPQGFYLTPKALVLYFQEYDIAPYASGFPEFSLPFWTNHSNR